MQDLKSLVVKARNGDLEAYGRIVRRFQDMVFGCGYAILGDFHLAEDVAQEAFVDAYRQLEKLSEPVAFPAWLYRIVVTHCGRVGRQKRVKTSPLDGAEEIIADGAGPAVSAQESEMKERVIEAVRTLPEHQRMATTLFYINGYTQKEIAEFLELPVTTVKKRLHDSRKKLKERMIGMVKETLTDNVPDEKFPKKVIDELLARPRLLEIEGHPVREIWDNIRAALPDYEVIEGGEVEDKSTFRAGHGNVYNNYPVHREKLLRVHTTSTILEAIVGREAPLRLLTAGRVFRKDAEDAFHQKVFHQFDGLCIKKGASIDELKNVIRRVIEAALGSVNVRFTETGLFDWVEPGFEIGVECNGKWIEVGGAGMLKGDVLRERGYDPDSVSGFNFGFGLDRMAMIKLSIDDIRRLWEPPYVPE